jgi:hypothetical protein
MITCPLNSLPNSPLQGHPCRKIAKVFLQRVMRNIHASAAQFEAIMTERDMTAWFSTTI